MLNGIESASSPSRRQIVGGTAAVVASLVASATRPSVSQSEEDNTIIHASARLHKCLDAYAAACMQEDSLSEEHWSARVRRLRDLTADRQHILSDLMLPAHSLYAQRAKAAGLLALWREQAPNLGVGAHGPEAALAVSLALDLVRDL